ncbi:MAG: methylmalonyl-CoA mutase family protein, partial [Acidobacteriota bacterium]|nr:methylmalonyl-CoA mutase family protein [Acidobacteriota bacterium]
HTNAMDEALGLPTEHAALLALRTQQVIANETGVCDTIDPLAGSYFIESLTDAIEQRARDYIGKIDEMGGAVRAIEKGFQQREIHEAAYRWQKRVEAGDAVVVGVNRFHDGTTPPTSVFRVDETLQRSRAERLRLLRERRDDANVTRALDDVEAAARSDDNLMPAILAAVEAYATVGEISDRMRAVFGNFHETFV